MTKDGKVFIDWYGRQAMVLKEKAAQRFFQRVAGLDERGSNWGISSVATSDKAVRVVRLAERDEEVARCFPVMVQLRPHLTEDTFVAQVARQRPEGY